jgi:hypothetical protein
MLLKHKNKQRWKNIFGNQLQKYIKTATQKLRFKFNFLVGLAI